jgi:hypothetical protein
MRRLPEMACRSVPGEGGTVRADTLRNVRETQHPILGLLPGGTAVTTNRYDYPVHECERGRRCSARARDVDTGEWVGAGVERSGTLCRACENELFADIRALPGDIPALEAALTVRTRTGSGPKISRTAELPVPLNLAADALLTEIHEEAARWARRLPGEGDDLAVICRNLGTLADLAPRRFIIWYPHPDGGDDTREVVYDGVDAILRLSELHRRADRMLGNDTPKTSRLTDPCHVCGRTMLLANLSTDLIRCLSCNNCWSQDEFARLNEEIPA